MKERILIVEDDPSIIKLVTTNLSVGGYTVACAVDGKQALDNIATEHFDLALCDIMMPEMDGFELLPHLIKEQIPVIFVSAKADVESRIQGLRLGAEDYLVKPFDILELLVRMEKVLARKKPQTRVITYADITVFEDSHVVSQNEQALPLKPMEYGLLITFLRHPGMVLTRENLLRQVWGDEYIGETRTVDVHVASLRKKLNWNDRITTVYKIGYRLEAMK